MTSPVPRLDWAPQDEIPDPRSPACPDVYYDIDCKDFWIQNERKDWITVNESSLKRHLRRCGFSTQRQEGEFLSPLDDRLVKIQFENDVRYAGPLAGYRKGIHEILGNRILVTSEPKLIEPEPGQCRIITEMLCNMLGEEQLSYVKGWLRIAFESLRASARRPGQVLVLAGERDCGKSLFQNLITIILGGRAAKPYRYMSGGTDFNRDLFAAEHLMIEDEVASTDIRARRSFSARVKEFTVNEVQSCHGKNREALSLTPFWRVTVSVNEEPENLQILPPLEDGIEDKLLLLSIQKKPMPMPTFSPEERRVFWETLLRELPAFLWELTNWEIPSELRCHRFGIKYFHHPKVVDALEELAPERKLLALIQTFSSALKGDDRGWPDNLLYRGTAERLQTCLTTIDPGARTWLSWYGAVGTYLGRLAKKMPRQVRQHRTATERSWEILKPEELG